MTLDHFTPSYHYLMTVCSLKAATVCNGVSRWALAGHSVNHRLYEEDQTNRTSQPPSHANRWNEESWKLTGTDPR